MDAIPLSPEEPLVGIAQDGQAVWAVLPDTVTGEARPALKQVLTGAGYVPVYDLPRGFAPTVGRRRSTARVWVEGTVGRFAGRRARRRQRASMSTVVLDKGRDASFAWVSADTVLAVSDGTLLRIDREEIGNRIRCTRTSV